MIWFSFFLSFFFKTMEKFLTRPTTGLEKQKKSKNISFFYHGTIITSSANFHVGHRGKAVLLDSKSPIPIASFFSVIVGQSDNDLSCVLHPRSLFLTLSSLGSNWRTPRCSSVSATRSQQKYEFLSLLEGVDAGSGISGNMRLYPCSQNS